MKEKYIIRICNQKTKEGKYVGVFYSKQNAAMWMRELFAKDKERLLKRMSEEEFETNYNFIFNGNFANIWNRKTHEDVCIYWIIKVEDAGDFVG